MYIKELYIKNFRGIEELNFDFKPGVNVLIGKNNSSKTAIIDAIRLCLSGRNPDGKRDIWFDKDKDLRIDLSGKIPRREEEAFFRFIFSFSPSELNASDKEILAKTNEPSEKKKLLDDLKIKYTAPYFHLANLEEGEVTFTINVRYFVEKSTIDGQERIKSEFWVGDDKQRSIPQEMWEYFYVVYLQPLRDAVAALQPPYSKLGEHFEFISGTKERREELAEKIHEKINEADGWKDLKERGLKNINDSHFQNLLDAGNQDKIDIGFLPFDFRRIANQLRIRLPYGDGTRKDNDFFELDQNGLGYNNLIFASTVLANIEEKKNDNISSFLLIEEPEAHLHPQLQNQFFQYLNNLSSRGYQIFLTSHSPTITAKADINRVIVLQNKDRQISICHICKLELKESARFLHKFLDVTKSQLFFANGVIFVEGYSEALCLEMFAKKLGFDLIKSGIEIVNIQGVSFSHFLKLFDCDQGLKSYFAVITDKDSGKKNSNERIEKLRGMVSENSSGLLSVSDSTNFEAELYAPVNREIINEIWKKLRPDAGENDIKEFGNNPAKFAEKVDEVDLKTELAYEISESLKNLVEKDFKVPKYIEESIRFVITGNKDEPKTS